MSDYLKIEYSKEKRSSTDYSSKLAKYLFKILELKRGQSLLEFGSGRAEILSAFSNLGLKTFPTASYSLSKPSGLFVTPTSDWESNHRIFYDDLSHLKPFTKISLSQMLEYGNFEEINIKTFRQLPIIWHSRIFNFLALLNSFFARTRAKNEWMRWSRELMIIGAGQEPLN